MIIVNDDSRVINKLEASLTDDARVVIYDRRMFIVQATGVNLIKPILLKSKDNTVCKCIYHQTHNSHMFPILSRFLYSKMNRYI